MPILCGISFHAAHGCLNKSFELQLSSVLAKVSPRGLNSPIRLPSAHSPPGVPIRRDPAPPLVGTTVRHEAHTSAQQRIPSHQTDIHSGALLLRGSARVAESTERA